MKGVVSGATDKSTISTPVQGGGREVDELLLEGLKPLARISRELDLSEQTLRNWRKQREIDEGERLKEAGIFPSMGRVGSALDNALWPNRSFRR